MNIQSRTWMSLGVIISYLFLAALVWITRSTNEPDNLPAEPVDAPLASPTLETSLSLQPPTLTLSPRWKTDVRRWQASITHYASQYQIDPNLIAAVMTMESGGNPNAVSRSGAIGLMQIMPFHSCATFDPDGNISCGVFILATYYHRAGDDWRTGLAYYNCGERGVKESRCGTTGGYAYADKVLNLYQASKGN